MKINHIHEKEKQNLGKPNSTGPFLPTKKFQKQFNPRFFLEQEQTNRRRFCISHHDAQRNQRILIMISNLHIESKYSVLRFHLLKKIRLRFLDL